MRKNNTSLYLHPTNSNSFNKLDTEGSKVFVMNNWAYDGVVYKSREGFGGNFNLGWKHVKTDAHQTCK